MCKQDYGVATNWLSFAVQAAGARSVDSMRCESAPSAAIVEFVRTVIGANTRIGNVCGIPCACEYR